MNKNNNTEEIKDAKGEVVRTLVFTDKDRVRTYKDKDTGETVKTLNICNGGVSDEQVKVWKGEHRKVHMIEVEDDGDLFVEVFPPPEHGNHVGGKPTDQKGRGEKYLGHVRELLARR